MSDFHGRSLEKPHFPPARASGARTVLFRFVGSAQKINYFCSSSRQPSRFVVHVYFVLIRQPAGPHPKLPSFEASNTEPWVQLAVQVWEGQAGHCSSANLLEVEGVWWRRVEVKELFRLFAYFVHQSFCCKPQKHLSAHTVSLK